MPLRRLLAPIAIVALFAAIVTAAVFARPGGSRTAPGTNSPAGAAPATSGATTSPEPGASPTGSPGAGPTASTAPTGSTTSPMADHLAGEVYGYLPYWEMDAAMEAAIEWNALSTIALFSVATNRSGALNTAAPGYKAITSERGRRIIAAARARGVRTELTYTSFGRSRNTTFFGDADAQAKALGEIRALARDLGVDGVNVDVEELDSQWFDEYGTFCGKLRAALRRDNKTATLSVATPTDTAGARMAAAALANGADRVFVMAYAYRWSGTQPGAIAPLDFRGDPLHMDLPATIAVYAALGIPADRTILGLPLYGMTWKTTGPNLGDERTGKGTSFIPRRNIDLLARAADEISYDPQEAVEWFAQQDATSGDWSQTFYDSPRSLAPKFQLAVDSKLAGIGFWALGYERGLPGYWELVKRVFGPPKLLAVSAPARTRDRTIAVAVSVTAGSHPLASVQLSADGTRWGDPLPVPPLPGGAAPDAPRPGLRWTIPGSRDGRFRLWVRAVDETGTISRSRTATIVVDTAGPILPAAPTLAWSTKAAAWRLAWSAASDPAGVLGYRVRVRTGTGAWVLVTERTTARAVRLPGIARGATFRAEVRAIDRLGNLGPARVIRRPAQ